MRAATLAASKVMGLRLATKMTSLGPSHVVAWGNVSRMVRMTRRMRSLLLS